MASDGTERDPEPIARPSDKTKMGSTRAHPPVPATNPTGDQTLVRSTDGEESTQVRSSDGGDATLVRGGDAGEATMVRGGKTEGVLRGADNTSRAGAARAPTASSAGQVFAGRFEVVRLLGEGGMGKVFEVRDRQIEGRAVALKVLLPKLSRSEQFRKLFFQEIRAAQKFVSEHVIQVRDTGQMDDGSLFLTMDLVDGESLRSLLDREKVLRPRHGLEIARQTLNGLQSGHDQGFIHRDIKPPNIMLAAKVPKTDENPYGVGVRILDFGIAGLAVDVGENPKAGTAMYMSPEQVKGERLDARSDLFAVGVMMYEMLSGARPFSGKTTKEVMDSVIETNLAGKVAEIEDLSPAVRRILERALQKDREKRFQSANEFAEAIAKSSAYQVPRVMPLWALGALGGLAVIAAGEGALLWTNSSKQEELRAQLTRAGNEKQDALRNVDSVHETSIRALEQQHKTELAALDVTLAARVKERDDFESQLTALQTANSVAETARASKAQVDDERFARLASEVAANRTAAEKAAAESEKFRADLEKANATIVSLQQAGNNIANEARVPVKTARGFDDVLGFIESRVGNTALTRLNKLASEQGIFADLNLEGAAFMHSLAEGAAALESYHKGVDLNGVDANALAALKDARTKLNTAKIEVGRFAAQASGWIGEVPPPEGQPSREARARTAVDTLLADVEASTKAIDKASSDEWTAINAQPATQDPSAAFNLADRYRDLDGNQKLAPLAKRFVGHLRTLSTDATLNIPELIKLGFLKSWADREALGQVPLDAADARDLRLYRCAQRWYDKDDNNDDFELDAAAIPSVTAAGKDWRNELHLQWQLQKALSNSRALDGRRLVYRQVDADGTVWWRQDEIKEVPPTGGALTAWSVVRTTKYSDGIKKRGEATTFDYERRGKVIRAVRSDVLIDLRDFGDDVSVEPFPVLSRDAVPLRLIDTSDAAEVLASFRHDLDAGVGPCLVTMQAGTKRWFSPRLGLVREETTTANGHAVLDLVYAPPIQ